MMLVSEELVDSPCIVSQGAGHKVVAHPGQCDRTRLQISRSGRTVPSNGGSPAMATYS